MTNFKNIHIGEMIEKRVKESELELPRITNFLNCTEEDVKMMYASRSIDSAMLLRWSKILQYDFFRIYSQHILLFSSNPKDTKEKSKETSLPQFRKNIYTKEIIDFILTSLKSGEKTKQQIINDYKIPKTTLYKWINKYDQEK
jgi:transcriptional regulator with PAS, ATPase and Fis domain